MKYYEQGGRMTFQVRVLPIAPANTPNVIALHSNVVLAHFGAPPPLPKQDITLIDPVPQPKIQLLSFEYYTPRGIPSPRGCDPNADTDKDAWDYIEDGIGALAKVDFMAPIEIKVRNAGGIYKDRNISLAPLKKEQTATVHIVLLYKEFSPVKNEVSSEQFAVEKYNNALKSTSQLEVRITSYTGYSATDQKVDFTYAAPWKKGEEWHKPFSSKP
ncbi:MAG: hypothetical protein ACREOI_24755 [bacterium]